MRTEQMAAAGFVDEVRGLLDWGYNEKLKPLQSLGYKQVIDFLRGRCDWSCTIDLINQDTWRYSKRQQTWFSADKEICWYLPDQEDEIRKTVDNFWNKNKG